jgi:hypothetical protein
MKGVLDDFKVMLTRKESSTCLAKAITILVMFGLGAAAAGLWAAAGPREYYDNNVTSFTFPSTTVYVGPNPDPDFVTPTRLMHGMTDEQLFWRATMVLAAAEYPFERTPKVAFMFLAGRGVLPLAPLWERFFRGHEDRFSVYVHAPPGVAINVSVDSPFCGRQIPSQVGCICHAACHVTFLYLPRKRYQSLDLILDFAGINREPRGAPLL